jgi:hypothetical protein
MNPEIRVEASTVEVHAVVVVVVVAVLGTVAMATIARSATTTCASSTTPNSVSPSSTTTTINADVAVPHATHARYRHACMQNLDVRWRNRVGSGG